MGECNPACWKIILNGGLIAISANLLAETAVDGEVHDAASELANTARAASETYEWLTAMGAVKRSGEPRWSGCEQALEIMSWVEDEPDSAAPMIAQMDEWRAELLGHMTAMIAGENLGGEDAHHGEGG